MSEVKLGDISFITKLAGFEHTKYIQGNNTHEKISEDDVPLFIGKTVQNGKIDKNFDWYIPKELSNQLERSKLNKKCLVLPYVGSVGDLAIFDASYDAHLGSNIAKIELAENCGYSEEFIYYFLKSDYGQKILLRDIQGAIQKNITMKAIREVSLPDISIQEQNNIVSILKGLDDKIQINNQINQELEAMAKTLYDYWFVQFDFPDQNGKPYKSSGGKMVYNQELKREIPEGWGVETLRDFESKIITGKTPSRANSDNFGGEIPFITIGDIRGNTFIYSTSESLTDLGASVQQNKYLPKGSLCVSCIATVGEIGFTTEWSHTNQQINSIVFEDKTHRYYLYFALKNYFENAKASAKTGNTFANMNKEDFSGIRIILSSKEIKNYFHEISEPYFAQIKCLQGENQELTQLRDWLLPMLMNGQVKV